MFYVSTVTTEGQTSTFTFPDYDLARQTYVAFQMIPSTAYIQMGGVGNGVMDSEIVRGFVQDEESTAYLAASAYDPENPYHLWTLESQYTKCKWCGVHVTDTEISDRCLGPSNVDPS